MNLTKEEEGMLNGEEGEGVQKAMQLVVKLGDIFGAEELVEIETAQAAGISYKSIKDPGLEWLEDFAELEPKARVPTFMNPAGMDLERCDELGFPEEFIEKQLRIIEALEKMDVIPSCSCTPYLFSNLPQKGEHHALAESSLVSFTNSACGARTNREGGPSALAAGICGRTGKFGYHIKENRVPTHKVDVDINLKLNTIADFGALGHKIGEIVEDGIPYFTGIHPSTDQLKALGAAMAASGAVALYHVQGVTPEALSFDISDIYSDIPKTRFDKDDLKEEKEKLNTGTDPDCIMIGCPHCSIIEIEKIARLVDGKNLKTDMWVCTSKPVKALADRAGFTKKITDAGGEIVSDTCMVVAPIEEMGYETVAVNSGKAAEYKKKVIFNDIETLLKEALE